MTTIDRDSEIEQAWEIIRWWAAPAECLDPPIRALMIPVYRWPTLVRHVFVATWPIAVIVRWGAVALLMAIWLLLGAIGHIGGCLNCMWRGLRSPWQ